MKSRNTIRLHTALPEDILAGKVTDVYFERTRQILEKKGRHAQVAAEFILKKFPSEYKWGIFAGLEEALTILEKLPVTVRALPEGTLFYEDEPVLEITGDYLDFGSFETALLGFFCQASGVATRAARCKKAAGERTVLSFGARRMHPALAPMIERNAYIGGCDGVASIAAAELIGITPSGTMPHALILILGDTIEAARAFDEIIDPKIPRVALVDTFNDEKFETLRVAEALKEKLVAIRLDTPSNRRGNFVSLAKEIRWELDLRGFQHVKIFLSGGIDEEKILEYNPVASAYGVGTAISNAPVLDFAMDLVEVNGEPLAKRGKKSGRKNLLACANCGARRVLPAVIKVEKCGCGGRLESLLVPIVENGKLVYEPPKPQQLRERVLEQIQTVEL
ncbi:MAG: nicotinate phosphoribosyltransferase [candidate division KSB1 bacterium]|nr:nicotinate phosphoribosyltransferase [candidate division KSB1 bacterium]MDZ7303828.1 nicotinate phosphoribosyltransferase [candidate division KSB1 bacterium]MDZ7312729.1 nicotinate phosphoribosyltransferase [candidate division KSB1 bacterium]